MIRLIGPIVLTVALVVLALGTAAMAFWFPSLSDITGVTSMEPKGKAAKKLQPEEIQAEIGAWKAPVLWNEPSTHHPLFNSIGYLFFPALYPAGNYIQENNDKALSPNDVKLSWYKKYGIDITSATVDREDPDNDGFSNLTEYKNEQVGERLKAIDCDGSKATNPIDAQSHPSYLARLRLQKYESRPFHILFSSYEQLHGDYVYQISLKDVPSSEQPPYKKTGDPLGFEGYVVGPFHPNIVTRINPSTKIPEQIDESTLELDKPEIGFSVVLTLKQETDSAESTADFVMLLPSESDKVIKVARGKILSISYIPGIQYRVIETNDDGAKIRDIKTNQDYHILQLKQSDWDEVPLPAGGNAVKTP